MNPLAWAAGPNPRRRGITGITLEMVQQAAAEGKRWRLVAAAELTTPVGPGGGGGVGSGSGGGGGRSVWHARVGPELLGPGDPLFGLLGADSAVCLQCDALGPVTLTSSAPTTWDTAYGLLSDLVHAAAP